VPDFFPWGYVGVDLFFTISGYLLIPKMIYLFDNPKPRMAFGIFIRRRLARLLPPFYAMLVLMLPLYAIFGFPNQHYDLWKMAISGVVGLANFAAYETNGDYFQDGTNPLTHIWSLSAEEQCYFFTPILIYFIFKLQRRRKSSFQITIIIAMLSFIASVLLQIFPSINSFFGIGNAVSFSYYSPIPRLVEFCLGGAAALSAPKLVKNITFSFFGLSTLFLNVLENSETLVGLIVAIFFASTCLSAKGINDPINHFLIPLKWIGDRSYSIYLYHLPVISIFKIYSDSFFTLLLSLIAILILGHVSYKTIETYGLSKSQSLHRVPVPKYSIYLTFTLVLFFVMFKSNYFGQFGKEIRIEYDGTGTRFSKTFMDTRCLSSHPCILDESRSRRILLVGDSRAEMYSRVLFLEAQKHGYGLDIWTSPGCRIYFETFLDKENPVDCFSKNTNLRKYLRDSTYDKIVVAEAIYSDSNLELMKSALKELLKSANEVYLFKEIPLYHYEKLFLQAPPLALRHYSPPPQVRKLNIKNQHLAQRKVIYSYAEDLGIDLIDPNNALCGNIYCFRFLDGKWLYFDPSHLSSDGANLISDEIAQIVFR
jgi:peptidoglycan/LPS O-acetylase OafA/YrhL